MYCDSKLDLATLMILTVLEVIVAVRFASHPSAVRRANSESFPPKTVTVVIRWFKFEPATETVHSGDIVEWQNDDILPYTSTTHNAEEKPGFDSGAIKTGGAWHFVARNKGTYDYICSLHRNNDGQIDR
jgi:plastocyanin